MPSNKKNPKINIITDNKKKSSKKNISDSSVIEDKIELEEEDDKIYNEIESVEQSESDTDQSETENIEDLEDKNIEVENEDLFGDGNNEIDDEDKSLEDEIEEKADDGEEGEVEDEGEGDEDENGCLYKFAVKNKELDSDEEVEEDEVYDDDTKIYDMVVEKDKRTTDTVLYMFERVRLLGVRARQLSRGAKPMLLNVEHLSPEEIARKELEKKVIPFIIVRTLPNGKKEHWHLDELEIIN